MLMDESPKSPKECCEIALTVGQLCIWRCDFKRKPCFDVNFVKKMERHVQKVYSKTEGSDTLSSANFDDKNFMYSIYISECFYSGVAMEQFQTIVPHPDAQSTSHFDWYPSCQAADFFDTKRILDTKRPICAEVFDGNMKWNSRVIVMDLLLLLGKSERVLKKSDPANKMTEILFPVKIQSKDYKDLGDHFEDYKDLGDHSALRIFFVYFWQPALENFRKVVQGATAISDPNTKNDLDFAIGEICHVLGITCRTQWMQIGFFHNFDMSGGHSGQRNQHNLDYLLTHCYDDKGQQEVMKHEYLPCRCENVLHLLRQHPKCLHKFVQELALVFTSLKDKFLLQKEVVIIQDDFQFNKCKAEKCQDTLRHVSKENVCYICNGARAIDLSTPYLKGTKHYKLEGSFSAHRVVDKKKNTFEDPRTKEGVNVYLFALLDVS
jgi:hypothetical protein